jgi:uroporphyrin-III C-methyltransferase/precorrin-2 dehydrogenase/sirohydrochlorin ferrochelatase
MGARTHPLFLILTGRRVLVVGAGSVGQRKIAELVDAGADVDVVAPHATPEVVDLAARGRIRYAARSFSPADVDGVWLVVAATEDAEVQREVAVAAKANRIFVVAVDDLPNASAYSASVVRRGPYTIAISSAGEAPALTRLLREILEQILPDEEWVSAAETLRAKWRAEGTPMGSRFGELVKTFREHAK